ncbi:MAG: site-2 protease family protein [Phycisphaerales bacterium]|nr:site-2 protease family protein [Phycisphaerales bacterium]
MPDTLMTLADSPLMELLSGAFNILLVVIGFSAIIFVHELGHFLAAKWVGIRVDRFAVGFGYRLIGWRRGEGLTVGNRPEYSADELKARSYGETDYCLKALPFGGYVRMLGQDDIIIDEKSNEVRMSDDPRAFHKQPVGRRMMVASAGVVFNVLLALVLFTIVFMAGVKVTPPVIGPVDPESTLAKAGLQMGDRILAVDGKAVRRLTDVVVHALMADEGQKLSLTIRRDGERLPQPIPVETEMSSELGMRILAVSPMQTLVYATDSRPLPGRAAPKVGDRLTHVNGVAVASLLDAQAAVAKSTGDLLTLTVERPDPKDPEKTTTVTCYEQRQLVVIGAPGATEPNLLGLMPLQDIKSVVEGQPAAAAGLKAGDVILACGASVYPTYAEITDNIKHSAGRDLALRVWRDGTELELSVRPRARFAVYDNPPPRIGVTFISAAFPDRSPPIIANVIDGTPGAAAGMPRGAKILSANGAAIGTWLDLVYALRAAAGSDVKIEFESAGQTASTTLRVPDSLSKEAGLPWGARIVAIDGQREIKSDTGGKLSLPNPTAVRAMLQSRIGQTVEVEYRDSPFASEKRTAKFVVTPDNWDPWMTRVAFASESSFEPLMELDRADNVFHAMGLGVQQSYDNIMQVLLGLKAWASRKVGADQFAGPVGIVQVAQQRASAGWTELLFFLGFLSVNLAVLNFLPLPVLDGGLMVFLLIEWIRGRPLSLKAQMISTMVGLAVILIGALFATINDVARILQ